MTQAAMYIMRTAYCAPPGHLHSWSWPARPSHPPAHRHSCAHDSNAAQHDSITTCTCATALNAQPSGCRSQGCMGAVGWTHSATKSTKLGPKGPLLHSPLHCLEATPRAAARARQEHSVNHRPRPPRGQMTSKQRQSSGHESRKIDPAAARRPCRIQAGNWRLFAATCSMHA